MLCLILEMKIMQETVTSNRECCWAVSGACPVCLEGLVVLCQLHLPSYESHPLGSYTDWEGCPQSVTSRLTQLGESESLIFLNIWWVCCTRFYLSVPFFFLT